MTSHICGRNTIAHFEGQHIVLCVIKLWRLSLYANKIESVGLRKCPYYCYLIEKVTSTDVRTTNILQSLPTQNGGKQLVWRNYVTVTLCIYHAQVCMSHLHAAFNVIVWVNPLVGSRPSDHYFRSVCLSKWPIMCLVDVKPYFTSLHLSVCLCRVFLSRLWSDFDQTRTHVICLGLVVSPRI